MIEVGRLPPKVFKMANSFGSTLAGLCRDLWGWWCTYSNHLLIKVMTTLLVVVVAAQNLVYYRGSPLQYKVRKPFQPTCELSDHSIYVVYINITRICYVFQWICTTLLTVSDCTWTNHYPIKWQDSGVCVYPVIALSSTKWASEIPHILEQDLIFDTLMKINVQFREYWCFGNVSNYCVKISSDKVNNNDIDILIVCFISVALITLYIYVNMKHTF